MEKLVIKRQVGELLSKLDNGNRINDNFFTIAKTSDNIVEISKGRLIKQKIKKQIGYLEDENCKIKNIEYRPIYVDGLKEDGSDDLTRHVVYFSAVYPKHNIYVDFGIEIDLVRSNYKLSGCGCYGYYMIFYELYKP